MPTQLIAIAAATMGTLLALTSAKAAPATIFSDDFESDTVGEPSGLLNWQITEGSIDVVFGERCGDGNKCIDLDGSTNQGGRIETGQFRFVSSQIYRLSFNYGSNIFMSPQGNSMEFGITDGLFVDRLGPILPATVDSFFYSIDFKAVGFGRLFFNELGNDSGGIMVDNIRLDAFDVASAPVPVPAAAFLFAPAIGWFVGRKIT